VADGRKTIARLRHIYRSLLRAIADAAIFQTS
jgi:hypothetical protein